MCSPADSQASHPECSSDESQTSGSFCCYAPEATSRNTFGFFIAGDGLQRENFQYNDGHDAGREQIGPRFGAGSLQVFGSTYVVPHPIASILRSFKRSKERLTPTASAARDHFRERVR